MQQESCIWGKTGTCFTWQMQNSDSKWGSSWRLGLPGSDQGWGQKGSQQTGREGRSVERSSKEVITLPPSPRVALSSSETCLLWLSLNTVKHLKPGRGSGSSITGNMQKSFCLAKSSPRKVACDPGVPSNCEEHDHSHLAQKWQWPEHFTDQDGDGRLSSVE